MGKHRLGREKLNAVLVEEPEKFWGIASVAERYEPERFHGWRGRLYRRLEERVICKAFKALPPGSRILDAPCGTGRIMSLLLENGLTIIGCDISWAMMAIARRRIYHGCGRISFFQTDIRHLPYHDASFDGVSCIGLLMHLNVDTRAEVLRELARVTQGLLVVQYGYVGAILDIWTWLTGSKAGNVLYPVDEAELQSDLEQSGLREVGRFWVQRPFSSSVILVLKK